MYTDLHACMHACIHTCINRERVRRRHSMYMHVYLYVEIRYCLGLHALLYSMKFLFHSKVDSLARSSRCGVLSDGKRLEKTKDWHGLAKECSLVSSSGGHGTWKLLPETLGACHAQISGQPGSASGRPWNSVCHCAYVDHR